MGALKFRCPHCDQKLNCGEEWAGQLFTCPKCGNEIVPPGPAPASPPPPPPGKKTQSEKSKALNWLIDQQMKSLRLQDEQTEKRKGGSGALPWYSFQRHMNTADGFGEFKRPLLSALFWWTGVAALFFALMSLMLLLSLKYDPRYADIGIRAVKLDGLYISWNDFWAAFIYGVMSLGGAQLFYSVRHQDYNTGRMVALLEKLAEEKK